MKTLIETSSPLYLKRMVRALNAMPHGFYLMGDIAGVAYNPRCFKASASIGITRNELAVYSHERAFIVPADKVGDAFSDHNGIMVVVSRHP